MYEPRTTSIIASSFTLTVVIIAIGLFSHFEWHQYGRTRQHHPPSWIYILSVLVSAATSIAILGFSISMLILSVFYNEKWIEVLLLLSGRVLLMQQAIFLWRFLRGVPFRSTSQPASWARRLNSILGQLHWIVFNVSACFFGSTIFVAEGLIRHQNRYPIRKISLVLLALEYFCLLGFYASLIYYSRRWSMSLLGFYQLLLALVPSLLGCISATVLSLLGPHQINWVLALWIHFGTAAFWLLRSIVIGVSNLLSYWRTQRAYLPSDDRIESVFRRRGGQGSHELADAM